MTAPRINRAATFAAAAALSLAGAAAQDSIQLTDGRFIVDQKISRHDDGAVIHFEHGDVVVPQALIRSCTAFEANVVESSYTAEEQKKVDKGQVLFEGRWLTAKKRDKILAERRKTRAAADGIERRHQRRMRRDRSRDLRLRRYEGPRARDRAVAGAG